MKQEYDEWIILRSLDRFVIPRNPFKHQFTRFCTTKKRIGTTNILNHLLSQHCHNILIRGSQTDRFLTYDKQIPLSNTAARACNIDNIQQCLIAPLARHRANHLLIGRAPQWVLNSDESEGSNTPLGGISSRWAFDTAAGHWESAWTRSASISWRPASFGSAWELIHTEKNHSRTTEGEYCQPEGMKQLHSSNLELNWRDLRLQALDAMGFGCMNRERSKYTQLVAEPPAHCNSFVLIAGHR